MGSIWHRLNCYFDERDGVLLSIDIDIENLSGIACYEVLCKEFGRLSYHRQ